MAITLNGTNGVTFPNGDTQNDVSGTVSQSGGLPTGAVFESGSNSNGSYIKFADGTMICYLSALESRSASGTLATSVTFPQTFANIKVQPYDTYPVAVTATLQSTVPNVAEEVTIFSVSTTGCTVYIQRTSATNTAFTLHCIGRWY